LPTQGQWLRSRDLRRAAMEANEPNQESGGECRVRGRDGQCSIRSAAAGTFAARSP
jgi:hypothetical protein